MSDETLRAITERLRDALERLLDAIDANDQANIHGWSVAARAALAATPAQPDPAALRAALERIMLGSYDETDECRWCRADIDDDHPATCPSMIAREALIAAAPASKETP